MGKGRLEAFTDGVIAIIITIMVLEIKVPPGAPRRFTRLTNAFSKKVENHAHSVALFALYYNFVRIHKTLRTTPAMAAKVTERLWEIGNIVDVLEAWEGENGRQARIA